MAEEQESIYVVVTFDREYECPSPSCACSNKPDPRGLTNFVKCARIPLVISLIVSSERQEILKFSWIAVANVGSI